MYSDWPQIYVMIIVSQLTYFHYLNDLLSHALFPKSFFAHLLNKWRRGWSMAHQVHFHFIHWQAELWIVSLCAWKVLTNKKYNNNNKLIIIIIIIIIDLQHFTVLSIRWCLNYVSISPATDVAPAKHFHNSAMQLKVRVCHIFYANHDKSCLLDRFVNIHVASG